MSDHEKIERIIQVLRDQRYTDSEVVEKIIKIVGIGVEECLKD